MARRLTHWLVESMVSALTEDEDVCLVLHPSMAPTHGAPRVVRDGKRWTLHRYLYFRLHGEDAHTLLLPGGCQTEGCMNPNHRIEVRRGSSRAWRKCPKGHTYTIFDVNADGSRSCSQCKKGRRDRYNEKRRQGRYPRGFCRQGHRLTPGNSYVYNRKDGTTGRKCRTCQIENQRAYRERSRKDD